MNRPPPEHRLDRTSPRCSHPTPILTIRRAVAGACIADEPDCDDTAVPGGDPSDLPPPADTPDEPSPTGMLVGGGLSVADALATDATGIIAVKGFC